MPKNVIFGFIYVKVGYVFHVANRAIDFVIAGVDEID